MQSKHRSSVKILVFIWELTMLLWSNSDVKIKGTASAHHVFKNNIYSFQNLDVGVSIRQ